MNQLEASEGKWKTLYNIAIITILEVNIPKTKIISKNESSFLFLKSTNLMKEKIIKDKIKFVDKKGVDITNPRKMKNIVFGICFIAKLNDCLSEIKYIA